MVKMPEIEVENLSLGNIILSSYHINNDPICSNKGTGDK